MVAVLEGMTQRPDDIICWTDSMVIQQYIANESRRFKTFVANRLAEIHDLTSDARWRHVPGKLNPADDCSRGLPVHALTHDHRWLAGPEFLRRDVCQWPTQKEAASLSCTEEDEEKREVFVSTPAQTDPIGPDPARFSSWTKYKRVVGWVKAFLAQHEGMLARTVRKTRRSSIQLRDEGS